MFCTVTSSTLRFTTDRLLISYLKCTGSDKTLILISFSISDKTEYEVVKVQGKEYFVITEVNDHELIAEYVIDKNGVYNIVTDYYKFIDKNSGDSYQYIQLKSSPKVQFSVEETENTSW